MNNNGTQTSRFGHIGLDDRMRAFGCLANRQGDVVTGAEFDSKYEIQSSRVRASQPTFKDLVHITSARVGTGVGIGTGGQATFTDTLTPQTPQADSFNFAIPFVSIYENSVHGSNQIYPRHGGSVSFGDYRITAGLDWQQYNGTNSVFIARVENLAAGVVDIIYVSEWKYLLYNTGLSTSA